MHANFNFKMASRWRVWEGDAHVDSHGFPPEDDKEPIICVRHPFDWTDIPYILERLVIHDSLRERVLTEAGNPPEHPSNDSNTLRGFIKLVLEQRKQFQMRGVSKDKTTPTSHGRARGRAETVRMRLKARAPEPKSLLPEEVVLPKHPLHTNDSKMGGATPNDFVPDKQTLYFKHLPKSVTEKELNGSISQFGKVSVCKIYQDVDESTAYVRLEDPSVCDWIISFYNGTPYNDESAPLECDYVIPQLELEHVR